MGQKNTKARSSETTSYLQKSNTEEKKSYPYLQKSKKNYDLEPALGLFPKDVKVTTQLIQKIGPQTQEMKEKNMHSIDTFYFARGGSDPFAKFPNVVSSDGSYWKGPTGHPFFDAFFIAYATHGEVAISPDDIWIQITFELSKFIDYNAESLRKKIVTFDGKEELIVFVDGTKPQFSDIHSKEFRWDSVIEQFSSLIRKNTIGKLAETIEADFSTSKGVEIVASQISLMNSCKKFFEYSIGIMGCGITKVHFFGELEDWLRLKEKTNSLREYAPSFWIDNLIKIEEEFIKTFQGNPDVSFWNQVARKFDGYHFIPGPSGMLGDPTKDTVLTGWLLDFFLFDGSNKLLNRDVFFEQKPPRPKDRISIEELFPKFSPIKGVTFHSIQNYAISVPVFIQDQLSGKKEGVEFISGFTSLIHENNVIRPQISFGVANRGLTDAEEQKDIFEIWKKKNFLEIT